jgi:hypothetical protein
VKRLLLIVIAGACVGCASSSYRNNAANAPRTKQVNIIANDVRFRPLLQSTFESHGFQVVANGTPGALRCVAKFEGFTFTKVEVSLWDGSTKLISGTASNNGWGNWVAHDAAKQGVISNAVDEFDKELSSLQ